MQKLKQLNYTFILLAISLNVFSQEHNVGILIGASNYHGDLAPEIAINESHFSGGLYYKYDFNKYWSVRPTLSYLKISGNDQNFKGNQLRNLSFESRIFEASSIFEFNYMPFSNNKYHESFTFYALMGPGIMYHSPTAELEGERYDLQKMRVEGQRYSKVQFVIPFGGGVKYMLTKNILIGGEINWRKTYTDYLDDVSGVYPNINSLDDTQAKLADRSYEVSENGMPMATAGQMRGDPNLRDWYFNVTFFITYKFTPVRCWPSR